jgi:hypothetical protein
VSVASKHEGLSTKEVEELLDAVDLTMERLKTLYEQYFLGIQKQAPAFLHNDVERKLRDLTQMNVRNTGLRYRLATLTQKFGSYNSYWRRTLRQIENGTYIRNLAKIGREAIARGSDIPEEILAAMPKRMREQVVRDRDAAIAIAKRRNQIDDAPDGGANLPPEVDDVAAMISEPSVLKREMKTQSGAHILEDDGDLDFDSLFAAFNDDDAAKPAPSRPSPAETQAITRPVPRIPMSAEPPPSERPTMAMPRMPTPAPGAPPIPAEATGPVPVVTPPTPTSAIPRVETQPIRPPMPGPAARFAPSQASRPNPIAPGSSANTAPVPVESMAGPFPREKPAEGAPRPTPSAATPAPGTGTQPLRGIPTPRPTPTAGTPPPVPPRMPTPAPGARAPTPAPGARAPTPPPGARAPTPPPGGRVPGAPAAPLRPPPGMTEADVNALHAKYVQAKQMVGEKVDAATSREKLLRTINQTAPKVMEQYKAAGVDFTVVVKDNQVVIKAKPKG